MYAALLSIDEVHMNRVLVLTAVVVATAVGVSAQKQNLTDQEKTDAVRIGTKARGRLTGLFLMDSGRAFSNALLTANNPYATPAGGGFSIRVYSPMTWIEQMAADAAKRYQPFSVADITEDMLSPVLRVVVFPDKPTRLTGAGLAQASSVEHVVLRDEAKTIAVQPLAERPFSDVASSALRDAAYEGVQATFALDELGPLRGPRGDREFYIVVVGNGTAEKAFKIKQKHFERLP
jgi:hypothetical protein